MKVRIRGPAGQSTVTLEDSTTVEKLRKTISRETRLPEFDVKYGYPPKPLLLDQLADGTKLSDLDFKLNGEQLIVSRKKLSLAKDPRLATVGTANNAADPIVVPATVQDSAALGRSDAAGYPAAGYNHAPFSIGNSGTDSTRQSGQETQESVQYQERKIGPLSLNRKGHTDIMNDPPEVLVPEHGGTLVLRIMPDDNSCLFRAIATPVMPGMDAMNELRSVVAQAIQSDPLTYSKVVLDDQEPDDYCRWIQTEDAWGGAIELLIFSKHFDIEICSIDVQTLRIDRFNEGRPQRCFLVYSGIHYDTIALSPFDMPPEFDVKIFDSFVDDVLTHSVGLCHQLQQKKYFTDVAGFQLRCKICGVRMVGEKAAQEHGNITGHDHFEEA